MSHPNLDHLLAFYRKYDADRLPDIPTSSIVKAVREVRPFEEALNLYRESDPSRLPAVRTSSIVDAVLKSRAGAGRRILDFLRAHALVPVGITAAVCGIFLLVFLSVSNPAGQEKDIAIDISRTSVELKTAQAVRPSAKHDLRTIGCYISRDGRDVTVKL
jgi:hypothetical protein